MPKQRQEDYWEEQWSERDVKRQIEGGPKKAWWPDLRLLLRGFNRGSLILEAGCGLGQFVYLLHEDGWRVMGVDVAEQAIRRTKQLYPQLNLSVQDVTRLDLPDASVGMYVSLGVVEHLREGPDAILSEAARVLADDAILFITVPYFNLYRRLREPWWRIKHRILRSALWARLFGRAELVFYQYAFSRSEFESILGRHGFVPHDHKLHHSHVALTKDVPILRRLRPKRLRRIAGILDRLHPALMSHMILITARRADRTVTVPPSD